MPKFQISSKSILLQKPLYLALLVLITSQARADLNKDQNQGLRDTQSLLTNPAERGKYIKSNVGASDVDAKVEALTGSAGKEDVYGLSSQLMERIATETNGDPVKMQALLNDAQKNPEAFYGKYFSAEQKAKVKAIAEKSEARSPTANAPH